MLKITGGELRGRALKAPSGLATRPTAAKMRQALFNIIGPRVAGARVADLFAGSGALGLEALSRGAASCLFVEKSRPAAKLIQANLAGLGLEERGRVVAAGLEAATQALREQAPYDLVLADPPYDQGQVERLLALAAQGWLLAPQGRMIVEHSPSETPRVPAGLKSDDRRRYGQSELSFFTCDDRPERDIPMKAAIYPGSFDPITNGHLSILHRGLEIFDEVVVAVAVNPDKKGLFSIPERVEMINDIIRDIPGASVDTFDGLLVDYVLSRGTNVILRGLRALSDFEYEFQMALMNRKLSRKVQSVFLMTDYKWFYVSSTIIKEAALLGGDINGLVPASVSRRLKQKYADRCAQGDEGKGR